MIFGFGRQGFTVPGFLAHPCRFIFIGFLSAICSAFPIENLWAQTYCGVIQQNSGSFNIGDTAAFAQLRSDTLITIPVVAHVLFTEDTPLQNLNSARIQSQIEIWNQDFQALTPRLGENYSSVPAEFRDLVGNPNIAFCLDTIIRVQTIYPRIGNIRESRTQQGDIRLFQSDLGGSDTKDPDQFLNLYIAPTGGAYNGISIFPDPARRAGLEEFEDGIILNPSVVGMGADNLVYNLGSVGTHELGHYFGLSHTWGDTLGCDSIDDGLSDTPIQEAPYFNCPVHPSSSCDGGADMFMNFMDYTDDACKQMFTIQQARLMRDMIRTYRPLLQNAPTCTSLPTGEEPEILLLPNPASDYLRIEIQNAAPPYTVELIDLSGKRIRTYNDSELLSILNVTDLPPAVYTVRLITEKKIISKLGVIQ